MKVIYLTREYPPHVYGGAGVHVEHLAAHMASLAQVEVKCFDERKGAPAASTAPPDPPRDPDAEPGDRPRVRRYPYGPGLFADHPQPVRQALMTVETGLRFNAEPLEADVVHCHTWYSAMGGILANLAYGVPLVVTVHSLEPLRPWKREQLGRGYDLSLWLEHAVLAQADAVIAVSNSEVERIGSLYPVTRGKLRVVPNGIDPDVYRPVETTEALQRAGIDPGRPYVLFLGRISRQKGIDLFLRAAARLPRETQIVLCAASPDSPGIEKEVAEAVSRLRADRPGVVWIREHIERRAAIELYSHAALFCCPSVYEPFGIINLEAMACETPVVATAIGGIPDVVVPGKTGVLIDVDAVSSSDALPADPERVTADLAAAMSGLLAEPERCAAMGRAGRRRVLASFTWKQVASDIHEIYQALEPARRRSGDRSE